MYIKYAYFQLTYNKDCASKNMKENKFAMLSVYMSKFTIGHCLEQSH